MKSEKLSNLAVGILFLFINILENSLLDSSWDENLFGPKINNPFSLNKSTIPIAKGCSGPTIVKSIFSFNAKFKRASILSALIFTVLTIEAIPALPGAQNISDTLELFLTDQQIECSLPPEPTTRTLIKAIIINFYATVTTFAKFLGWSIDRLLNFAKWNDNNWTKRV